MLFFFRLHMYICERDQCFALFLIPHMHTYVYSYMNQYEISITNISIIMIWLLPWLHFTLVQSQPCCNLNLVNAYVMICFSIQLHID